MINLLLLGFGHAEKSMPGKLIIFNPDYLKPGPMGLDFLFSNFGRFFTLLFGTTAAYACRTTMPLVAPSIAKNLEWSKTEVGTVLSSFFWGYTLTQILGGYLSDR